MTIPLPLPPKELHPNASAKIHHMKKARIRRQYRETCGWAAKAAILRSSWALVSDATVLATFYFNTKRERDGDNLIAWIKAGIDGLVDAGVFEDDNRIKYLPVVIVVDKTAAPRVEIEVLP